MIYRTLLDRFAVLFILLFLAAAGGAAVLIPKLRVEAGTDVMLDQSDPDLAFYNTSRVDWKTTDEYVIFCCSRDGWFTEEGRATLRSFVEAVRKLPHCRTVTAVTTVPLLQVKAFPTRLDDPNLFKDLDPDGGDELVDVPLKERSAILDAAKRELLAHTQVVGNLLSATGKDINVLAYVDTPEAIERLDPIRARLKTGPRTAEARADLEKLEPDYQAGIVELNRRRQAMVDASRALAHEWSPKMAEPIRLSGLPILNRNIVEHIQDDVRTFGIVSLAAFTLTFLAIYRRLRWVVLPILACLLPVQIILGLMVALDERLTIITSNLPVLLFVLTLPYSVYLIERIRERRGRFPEEPAAATATGSAHDIWVPCLFSATTTMAGTASLLTSGIIPVRTFGAMATLGLAVALGAIFLFLASAFRMLKPVAVRASGSDGILPPLRPLAGAALRVPGLVVALGAVLLGVSTWGATKVTAETKVIDYFRPTSETYVGLEYIDKRMGGTTPLEIILKGGPGYFRTKEGLATLNRAAAYFAGVPETGNVRTFSSLVDEVAKSLGGARVAERALETVVKMAPELVREFCTEDYATSRVLVRMKETAPTLNRKRILDGLKAHLAGPEFAHLQERRATGVFLLYSNLLQDLLRSQRDTFLIVVIAIYIMVAVCFRNPAIALLVLLPQVLPVLLVLGVMGFAGIALDLVTTMIASMAMGVGIDAAIQYAVRYRLELRATGDAAEAVRRSHATIGRSILIATSIVFAGFLVLSFSKFVPTVWFGLFTGLAMVMGLLGSLTLLPSLFVLLNYPRAGPSSSR